MIRSVLLLTFVVLTTWNATKGQSQDLQRFVAKEVSFRTSDDGHIYASLYGAGDHAVVLAHGAIFNKESWAEQSELLARKGLRVLAIDFRGYGKSVPGTQPRAYHLDVLAAVRFLRRGGAKRVSVVGGSMGGGAAAQASVESAEREIDRLILLAHSPIAHPERLKGDKLFIVSRGDGSNRSVIKQYEAAPNPKKLVQLDGNAHAQHLFGTEQSDDLELLLVDWLSDRPEPK